MFLHLIKKCKNLKKTLIKLKKKIFFPKTVKMILNLVKKMKKK